MKHVNQLPAGNSNRVMETETISKNGASLKSLTSKVHLSFVALIFLCSSCSTTIPMLSNLSDQTMLLAKNKNIKANYSLVSDVSDGFITFVSVSKGGHSSSNNNSYKYASETAFKKMWGSYFQSKFNAYSKEEMEAGRSKRVLRSLFKSVTVYLCGI